MTTTPKPTPISDEDLAQAKSKLERFPDLQPPNDIARSMVARIEAQQAEFDELVSTGNEALKNNKKRIEMQQAFLASKDAEIERLREASMGLLNRLDEWSPDGLNDENAREWLGHVEPFQERLRMILAEAALKQEVR